MSGHWQAALAYALTGEEFDLPETGRPDPARLARSLDGLGWTRERLAAHAMAELGAERPWPHPVPAELRRGCGAAQFIAALGTTRELLELTALDPRPPSVRRRLDPDEQRLLREVPPHYGS